MNITTETILFYLPSFEAGGAERQALNLAIELKTRNNYHVVLAAQYKGGPIEIEALRYDITCIEIPFDFYYFNFYKISGFSISKFKAHLKFKAIKNNYLTIVKQVKPDFIFSYCYEPNVIASFFSNDYKNCKVIWNQRDTGIPPFTKCKIEQIAINNAFKIVGNSASSLNYVLQYYNESKKSSIIANGIQINLNTINKKTKKTFNFEDTDIVIGVVANYAPKKNHSTLIKSYALLNNKNIKLFFIGRFSESDKLVCQQNLINQSITFHYENENISNAIHICDIIVHPSLSEGMPNAILEAMAFEVPLIASDIEPHIEVLGKDYPLFFSSTNEVELAETINKILNNNEFAQTCVLNNKAIVNKSYTMDGLAQKYLNIINSK